MASRDYWDKNMGRELTIQEREAGILGCSRCTVLGAFHFRVRKGLSNKDANCSLFILQGRLVLHRRLKSFHECSLNKKLL